MAWTVGYIIVHVIACIVYVFCAYHVAAFAICPLRRRDARREFRKSCVDVCQRNLRLLWCSTLQPASPLGRAIQEKMSEFRLMQCEKIAYVMIHCLGPWMLVVAIRVQLNALSDPPDIPTVLKLCLYGFMYSSALLVATGYTKLTLLRLDCLTAAMQVATIAAVGTMSGDSGFLLHHSGRLVIRLMLSMSHMDFSRSIPWNIVFSIVTCSRYPYNSSLVKNGEDTLLGFAIREFLSCLVVSGGCYAVQMWLETLFRVQLVTNNQKRATLKLAAYQCDAVCWLSPELRLSWPAPQLAGMLFVEDRNNHMYGRKIEDYIASDLDRERFHDFLAQSIAASGRQGLGAVLHMDLRDSMNRTVPVELHHSCYVDDDDRIGHVLGITESPGGSNIWHRQQEPDVQGEQGVANIGREQREPGGDNGGHGPCDPGPSMGRDPPEARRQDEFDPADSMTPTIVGRRHDDGETIRQQPFDARSTHVDAEALGNHPLDSANDVRTLLVPLMHENEGFAPVSVMFDGCTYQIVACTVGLMTYVGPVVYKTHLGEYVLNFREFLIWMQDAVNVLVVGTGEETADAFKLRMVQPTAKKKRKFEFRAEAHVVKVDFEVRVTEMGVELGEAFEDAQHETLCVMELWNIEEHWLDEERRNTRRVATDTPSDPVTLHAL